MNTSSYDPGNKASSIDRRANPRRGIDVLMNQFLNGYPYLCRATDISRTGMRIRPMSNGLGGTRFVGLQFQLPGSDDVLTASGEVVSASEKEGPVGIRFTRLPAASAERLGKFLAVQA
jgi:hypothetical protein